MIKIAIIEDNINDALTLKEYIDKYFHETKQNILEYSIEVYHSSEDFLNSKNLDFDLVFIDIELPNKNGMDLAFELRKTNNMTQIVFVTNLIHYAIKGYQVDAIDYIIKPVNYKHMVSSIDKAIKLISSNIGIELLISQRDKVIRIKSKDIYYIEVADHKLTYHTVNGKIIEYGSLTDLEKILKPSNFMRCNACYLVNPKYINYVEGFFAYIKNGDALKISRPRKKRFMLELTEWLGKGNFS